MLVVITIIGILAALGGTAVFKALEAAKKARIKAEITNLESAIQQFKSQYGDFPPSYFGDVKLDASTTVDVTKPEHPVRKFLSKACPRMNEPAGTWSTLKSQNLTPAQALTFWLHGFSKDPTLPISGSGGWQSTNSGDSTPLFDFDKTRFYDKSGSPWTSGSAPVYVPIGGKPSAPYVYMDAKSYYLHAIDTGANRFPVYLQYPWDTNNNNKLDTADVKLDGTGNWTGFQKLCANEKSFQLISAGLDSDYGGTGVNPPASAKFVGSNYSLYYKSYPDGLGYDASGADDDNITNFSERPLGDAKP